MLQHFEKISPLVESLRCALHDEVHIIPGCWGPVTSLKMAMLGAILDFTENYKLPKNVKNWNFVMLSIENMT